MEGEQNITIGAELVRKGIHLFALVIPIGYILVPDYIAICGVALSAIFSILIDISRFRGWFLWRWLSGLLTPIIRPHEIHGKFTGASYILSTSALSMLLFPKPIAIAAIVYIIIGDTAAAIVGRMWGKHKLIGKKTYEGSLACLVSISLVSFLIPNLPTPIALAGALAATMAEALSGKLDDNFTVQMVSGFVMLGLMALLDYEGARLFEVFVAN